MTERVGFDFLINAKTKSKARVIGIPVKSFLEGQRYRYSFSVTNLSERTFSGGELRITVIWPTQQTNNFSFELPEILPNATFQTEERESGVMARGYGLFFARMHGIFGAEEPRLYHGSIEKPIEFKEYIPQANRGTSFHILFGRSNEEIYEFWAMVIAAISLGIIALEKIVEFMQWLLKAIP